MIRHPIRRRAGDAQISAGQLLRLAGAVIVTTPQDLALMDARRGVTLFRTMKACTLSKDIFRGSGALVMVLEGTHAHGHGLVNAIMPGGLSQCYCRHDQTIAVHRVLDR